MIRDGRVRVAGKQVLDPESRTPIEAAVKPPPLELTKICKVKVLTFPIQA